MELKMLRYKACQKSIVTLKLLNGSKTNEKRNKVSDSNYAKFRCNKAKVIAITDVETGKNIDTDKSVYNSDFKYIIGKIVKDNKFDKNVNKVCSEGIHYFKAKKAALSWFYINVKGYWPEGEFSSWHTNGNKKCNGFIKNRKKNGKFITLINVVL